MRQHQACNATMGQLQPGPVGCTCSPCTCWLQVAEQARQVSAVKKGGPTLAAAVPRAHPPGLASLAGLPAPLLRSLGDLGGVDLLNAVELSPQHDLTFDPNSPVDAYWAAQSAGLTLGAAPTAPSPFAAGPVRVLFSHCFVGQHPTPCWHVHPSHSKGVPGEACNIPADARQR